MTSQAYAEILASMVCDDLDVIDVLSRLVADCAEVTGGAVSILAREGSEELALLAATSHRAVELELLQLQRREGPCIEAITSGRPVSGSGAALAGLWGPVGPALVAAGFARVEAFPLRWHGAFLGALNIFLTSQTPVEAAVGQAFADMSTLTIVQSIAISAEQVQVRLHDALTSREIIEQAKGALAYTRGLDLEAAYAELLRLAAGSADPLTQVAREVVRRRGRPD